MTGSDTTRFRPFLCRLEDRAVPSATLSKPATAIVQINDGTAQRSMVTSLKVVFSEPVTFASGIDAAIQLERIMEGSRPEPVRLNLVQKGNSVLTGFEVANHAPGSPKSLVDGNYKLTLVARQIQSASGALDGNRDGIPGGDLVVKFHRLFGDANGDRRVDSTDFLSLRQTLGTGMNLAFDSDGNGNVGAEDLAEFRKRFGMTI